MTVHVAGDPAGQAGRAGRAGRGTVATTVAVALLIVVPLAPRVASDWSARALVGLPVESIIVLLLLAVLPWRMPRLGLATGFGAVVAIAVLLAGIDRGYEVALGIPFVPLDWPQLGDAFGVVAASIGTVAAGALVGAAGLVVVAIAAGLAWAALRVDAVLRRSADSGRTVLAVAASAWIAAAAMAPLPGATDPVAAAASTDSLRAAVSRTVAALEARDAAARAIAHDPYAQAPPGDLLAALQGKDVVFVFVESYGRVALEGQGFSRGVDAVLRRGEAALAADGYAMQSAWLTSPTFGGTSWLAHATLQSGVWVDSQAVYGELVGSDRLTIAAAFARAGWRTVSDVPSNTQPWDVGTTFYRYDTLLDATNVGYRGPSFGYARVPDQYTLRHFADHVLADADRPVMAEIDLVSSHTPWAPLPVLVPWERIGDGSVFDAQPARSTPASTVWERPETVRAFYGRSIEYSLGATLSFLDNVDDPDLVVVVLGDHQPASIVSGPGAGHDVPVSIVARDPAVLDEIAGWGWQPGLRPGDEAPVWRMDAFRDRFFAAFGSRG